MSQRRHPALYQINTRVWLTELSRGLGRPATLDDIPGRRARPPGRDGLRLGLVPERLADRAGRAARLAHQSASGGGNSRRRCRTCARRTSPAPASRSPATRCIAGLGGDAALARLRERLRGARPAADARLRPQPHRPGSSLGRGPPRVLHPRHRARPGPRAAELHAGSSGRAGDLLLAHGRDPYFAGWPDTLQLNYANPATQEAMIGELLKIAGQCDGVRCDMAMLVLPDVFERTWGRRPPPFWPKATAARPGAASRASASWPRSTGTWSGRCSSRASTTPTTSGSTTACARATPGRCASTFTPGSTTRTSSPASWKTTTSRGPPRAFAPGDARGGGGHHVSVAGPAILPPGPVRGPQEAHLAAPGARAAASRADAGARSSSTTACSPCSGSRSSATASGNCSNARPPGTATGRRTASSPSPGKRRTAQRLIVAVNYAGNQSQCYVRLPFPDLAGRAVRLRDLTGPATYDREGGDVVSRGLYLDLPAWGYHVFELTAL